MPGSLERQRLEAKIKVLRNERAKQRAKDLHALQEADEKLTEAKINYGNAKHERKLSYRAIKTLEDKANKYLGIDGFVTGTENLAKSDSRASFEANDTLKKMNKKLDAMQKAAEKEKELRELTVKFKEELQNMEVNGEKISEEEANSMFEQFMSQTVREASDLSVKASFVTKAVNDVLFEKKSDKVEPKDVDGIIDKIKDELYKAGKKTVISNSVKQEIKDEIERQMIGENQGLGLEDRVAAEIIRRMLGRAGNTKSSRSTKEKKAMEAKMSDSARATREELLNKLVQIHTDNDIGKIKHKSELIKSKKAIKDAKKKKVGGK